MQVIKRDGRKESVKFDKISRRVSRLCKDLKNVDPNVVAQKVIQGIYDGVTTKELDTLCMETAYSMSIQHPEYDKLASRLAISTLHKETDSSFSTVIQKLYGALDISGKKRPIVADDIAKITKKHAHIIDNAINYDRDYLFDYFGFKTLERSYLLKINYWKDGILERKIVERPQHMWMRVAVGIHKNDIDAALETYNMLSTFQATHATPTLFNAGTVKNQMSSCFLISMAGNQDSIDSIYETLQECALISQHSGGIGLHIHNIRSEGSPIYGTGGISNGIVPMLRVFNETARYVDQGGGKRKGSFAIYLEPWHADVFEFLDLRKNNGKEEMRARDLNLAIWTPDLFFERVEKDEQWTLMDPNKCKGLSDVHSEEFNALYTKYEKEGLGERTVKARDVWSKMLESCIETGEPYILAKDAANKKSNQKNLGTIKSSNLCVAGKTKLTVRFSLNVNDDEYIYTIKQIIDMLDTKDEIYVKSYNLEKQRIVFSKVLNGALTRTNAEVVRIYDKLICTPDHKIYTKDHGYIEADELRRLSRNVSDASSCDFILYEDDYDWHDGSPGPYFAILHQEDIETLNETCDVYDITVEDTNNFFADGILVHNCAEIIEYSDPEKIAVCNLASISLPSCIDKKKKFNFEKLYNITAILTKNLNKVIDTEYYPLEKCKTSNFSERPIGIGVQGLASVFAMLRLSWESEEARILNKEIFETIYYAAVATSCELAKEDGAYETFKGSPASEGLLQPDLWGAEYSDRYDWAALKKNVKKYGLRNSLLLCCMPSASTSQVLGNTECIEAFTSNIFKRATLSGEFIQINKYLVEDLIALDLWNDTVRQKIIAADGSIQNIAEIPDDLKLLYKTVWEIPQRVVIDMAADRGPFICQSQSMNLYFKDANFAKLTSAFFYAWKKGLKTIVYYTRSTAAREATKFTVDREIEDQINAEQQEGLICSLDNPEACDMCGS